LKHGTLLKGGIRPRCALARGDGKGGADHLLPFEGADRGKFAHAPVNAELYFRSAVENAHVNIGGLHPGRSGHNARQRFLALKVKLADVVIFLGGSGFGDDIP
jgi:hypothetical protein